MPSIRRLAKSAFRAGLLHSVPGVSNCSNILRTLKDELLSRVSFDWLLFVLYPRFSKSNVEHCVYWTFMFDIFYLEQSEVGRWFTSFFIGYILLFFFNVIITKRCTYIIWNIYYKRNYLKWKRHLNYYTILRNNKKNSDDKESYQKRLVSFVN